MYPFFLILGLICLLLHITYNKLLNTVGRYRKRKKKNNWPSNFNQQSANSPVVNVSTTTFCDTCGTKFVPAATIELAVNPKNISETGRDNSDVKHPEKFIEGFTFEMGKYKVDMCIYCVAQNKHKELPKDEPTTPVIVPSTNQVGAFLPALRSQRQRITIPLDPEGLSLQHQYGPQIPQFPYISDHASEYGIDFQD